MAALLLHLSKNPFCRCAGSGKISGVKCPKAVE